jgi:integrase
LLAACNDVRRQHLRPIIVCALDTGMRQGEIFSLRWREVDFDNSVITVDAFNTKTMRSRTNSLTTRLVGAHIPLSEVGRVLGHTQANTTYRYVNANIDTARRAAAALDAFNELVEAAVPASDSIN